MRNRDRERLILAFAELYFPEEVEDMLQRMPTEKDDPEGSLFDEYFGMIQTVSAAAGDSSLSPEEKNLLEAKMKLVAHKFGYPKEVIINLEAPNDTTS